MELGTDQQLSQMFLYYKRLWIVIYKVFYFKKMVRLFIKIFVFLKLRAYYLTISVSSVHKKKRFFNMGNI